LADVTSENVNYSAGYFKNKKLGHIGVGYNTKTKPRKLILSKKNVDETKTNLKEGSTEIDRYLYLEPLKKHVDYLEGKKLTAEGSSKVHIDSAQKYNGEIHELDRRIREKKKEKAELEKKLAELQTQDLATLESKF